MKKAAPAAPPACLVSPTTLSDDVKAFIDARLKAQSPQGSSADIEARVTKMEKALADARANGLSGKDLGLKISEFERFQANVSKGRGTFIWNLRRSEFRVLRNMMILQCMPKNAAEKKP